MLIFVKYLHYIPNRRILYHILTYIYIRVDMTDRWPEVLVRVCLHEHFDHWVHRAMDIKWSSVFQVNTRITRKILKQRDTNNQRHNKLFSKRGIIANSISARTGADIWRATTTTILFHYITWMMILVRIIFILYKNSSMLSHTIY